eukprot:TRINITY_DN4275_c0_g1_i1.p1 TRINITY_DN4275_c0_g1~~TRINITY_DN4275_c0_g1_i1.p1  ORF type:complete len:745 (+),score=263.09 TRINITY_DN4275_c0_g1_i1:163-2397(+)
MPTKRVKGRPKKKSIKAKIHSRIGSKARTQRMGKELKKGDKGVAANFLTRAKVLKKLQLSLKDFRRLCILKGIYPREPSKKPSGKDKTYYHIKDVSFLAHEPLINSFREFKAFMKKIRKAAGRRNISEVRRKEAMAKPTYTLHHLVRERYPRFTDAVRDLDDALCLVHMFAAMPQVYTATGQRVESCKRLVKEWQFYVARSHCLSKVFVSIKGIYFQANIMGLPVTWLAPHQFTTELPPDVDFRIMLTFLEFYEVLLKFVMFKLYTGEDLRYPPVLDHEIEGKDGGLLSVKAQPLVEKPALNGAASGGEEEGEQEANNTTDDQVQVTSKAEKRQQAASAARIASLDARMKEIAASDTKEMEGGQDAGAGGLFMDDDDDQTIGDSLSVPLEAAFMAQSEEGASILHSQDSEEQRRKRLFKGLRFFLGREVPKHWMEFAILSCGGTVGWDGPGSPFGLNDSGITHQIVDRPVAQSKQQAQHRSRELVQPQWVLDSINAAMRLPSERYKPGAELPPHLSPFVEDTAEGYIPAYREELNSLKAASKHTAYSTITDVSGTAAAADDNAADASEEEDEESADDDQTYAREVEMEASGVNYTKAQAGAATGSDDDVDDDSQGAEDQEAGDEESMEEEVAEEEQDVVEAMASSSEDDEEDDEEVDAADVLAAPAEPAKPQTEAQELHELSKIMMSKKAKRLYGRMQHGIGKKRETIDRLKAKRKAIESQYDKVPTAKASAAAQKKKQKRAAN